jgi:hypothetical protein
VTVLDPGLVQVTVIVEVPAPEVIVPPEDIFHKYPVIPGSVE